MFFKITEKQVQHKFKISYYIFRTLNSFAQNFGMDFVHVLGFYNFEAHNLVLRADVCTP